MSRPKTRGRWWAVPILVVGLVGTALPASAEGFEDALRPPPRRGGEGWTGFAPPRRGLSPQAAVPTQARSGAWQGTLLTSTARGGAIGAALGGLVALMSRNGPDTGDFWRAVGLGTAAGALVGLGVGSVRMQVLRSQVEDQPVRTNRMVPEDVPGGFGVRYRLAW